MKQETAINPFHANVPFLYPLKTSGFPMFSKGIGIEQRREVGKNVNYINMQFTFPTCSGKLRYQGK